MSHKSHNKERRQLSAAERKEARATRSAEEQLARLDRLLGKNAGAAKERARLLQQLEQKEPKQ